MSFLSEEQKVEFRTVVGKLIHRAAGKMIAKADQDGDGKLSWDEIKIFASTEEDKADFEAADFNKDGKVDHEELSKFLTEKALNLIKEKMPFFEEQSVLVFAKIEEQFGGKLDFEHLWGVVPEGFRTEERKEKAKAIFDKVDVDHSGTLDRAEFQQAAYRLVIKLANEILATEMGPLEWFKANFGGMV